MDHLLKLGLLLNGSSFAAAEETAAKASEGIKLDPLSLIINATGPVFVVVALLIVAAVVVWFVTALKLLQLSRWAKAEDRFERAAEQSIDAEDLFAAAAQHNTAPGARIALALQRRRDVPSVLPSTARRALVEEEARASTMMPTLASIGSAGPFIGLFGTVYGIMDAFLLIGKEKSASLPVVAPAIGEALIATAIGLVAAIPAVIAYNLISKKLDNLMGAIEASSEGWVALIVDTATPRQTPQARHAPSEQPIPLGRAVPPQGQHRV